MQCPYCLCKRVYKLQNGHCKCSDCNRKWSPKRVEKVLLIARVFCKDLSILQAQRDLNFSYGTIERYYHSFRKILAYYSEEQFNQKKSVHAFEEQLYLYNAKKREINSIFDAINFLTFHYDDHKIYNIIMPSLQRFKPTLLEDGLDRVFYKEIKQFLRRSHLQTETIDPVIRDFWSFFEEFIKKFKGVNREHFYYYLKEAEYKFSHGCDEEDILKLYYQYKNIL